MSLSRWYMPLGLAALLVNLAAARAQQFAPHIGYVYPAGGQAGSTFQVRIGGQYLDNTANVYVSGKGIQTKILDTAIPLTPQQANQLRRKLDELIKKKPKDANDLKEIANIRMKLEQFRNRGSSALADIVTVEITIGSSAQPGEHELRVRTGVGLSNPLAFHVGTLQEYYKAEPTSKPSLDLRALQKKKKPVPPSAEMTISQPAVINGQILPGGVDRYRFQARKGQQLVIAVSARALIPYLADAVPGWFQATMALYDASGNELAYDDHYSFHPDPVLFCKIPSNGDYWLEIRDALYRGREDFVYRITVGEQPYVTSVFPLGGQDVTPTTVKLEGWNLPGKTLTVDAKDKKSGVVPLSVRNEQGASNRIPFAVDDLPECQEQEPNNDQASAQRVTLPIIINGRIDRSGDWDVFRFEGRAGEDIVAEVLARRLDSPLDSVLRLTDASGKEVAHNDDHQDKRFGLHTHHADSLLTAKLPADGTYFLHLGDTQNQGGANHAYRLRISGPRPDFALRIVPSSISARPGTSVPFTVYALRKEGFSREITLGLRSAPAGFSLGGARVPANQDQVRMTLAVPANAPEAPVDLWLEGSALIQGRKVVRQVVPAEDMMQAFAYHHLVPTKTLVLSVTGRGRAGAPLRLLREDPVRLSPGGTATVHFALTPGSLPLDRAQLKLSDPPEGITIQKVTTNRDGVTIQLHAEADKVQAGLAGNLIVDSNVEMGMKPALRKPRAGPRDGTRRTLVSALPAIPFVIVGQKR